MESPEMRITISQLDPRQFVWKRERLDPVGPVWITTGESGYLRTMQEAVNEAAYWARKEEILLRNCGFSLSELMGEKTPLEEVQAEWLEEAELPC